jgi:TonB family protein
LNGVRLPITERGFTFALIVSAAIHVVLFSLLLSFVSGFGSGRVQAVTEIGIKVSLVSGVPAKAGKTAVLPGLKPRETDGAAQVAAVPAREAPEQVAPVEEDGIKQLAEIGPSNESSEMGHDAGAFSTPVVPISGGGDPSGSIGSGVPAAGRGSGELSQGNDAGDSATQREGITGEGGGAWSPRDTDPIPQYEDNVIPVYPPLALLRGYQGEAVLSVEVLADGRVGRVGISRSTGHEILDRTALKTVRTWRFDPGRRGGRPVTMSVDVPFRFVLMENSALVKADDQQ